MSRRGVAFSTVVVLAIGIGINVTGIAPISGGPVAADAPLPDGQFALATTQQLRPAGAVTLYTTLVLDSTWSVEPTLLSVTPIGANKVASVRVLGTSSIEGPTDLVIGSAWDPGPGWSAPGPVAGASIPVRENGRYLLVLVGISATGPEDAWVRGFQIDYAVGPFRFRSVDQTAILVCAAPGAVSSYPEYCAG